MHRCARKRAAYPLLHNIDGAAGDRRNHPHLLGLAGSKNGGDRFVGNGPSEEIFVVVTYRTSEYAHLIPTYR